MATAPRQTDAVIVHRIKGKTDSLAGGAKNLGGLDVAEIPGVLSRAKRLFRFGGEELALLCHETAANDEVPAERVRAAVAGRRTGHHRISPGNSSELK